MRTRLNWVIGACLAFLLVGAVVGLAQVMRLDDGTAAMKVVEFGQDGTEVSENSVTYLAAIFTSSTAIETAVEALQTDVATGSTLKRYISTGASDDEFQVKATSGVLMGISARNSNTSTDAYVKCTNLTAANTTPGSSTVFYEILVPAGPSGNNDATINAAFDTALTCYIVTGKADNDGTEVAADDVSYNLRYR